MRLLLGKTTAVNFNYFMLNPFVSLFLLGMDIKFLLVGQHTQSNTTTLIIIGRQNHNITENLSSVANFCESMLFKLNQ
jgi:hypothetical protein